MQHKRAKAGKKIPPTPGFEPQVTRCLVRATLSYILQKVLVFLDKTVLRHAYNCLSQVLVYAYAVYEIVSTHTYVLAKCMHAHVLKHLMFIITQQSFPRIDTYLYDSQLRIVHGSLKVCTYHA